MSGDFAAARQRALASLSTDAAPAVPPPATVADIDQRVAEAFKEQERMLSLRHRRTIQIRELIAAGTPETLRNDLRAALVIRDASLRTVVQADADVTRAREITEAVTGEVEAFNDLDSDLDRAALAQFRAQTLGQLPAPEIAEKIAARVTARQRLDTAQRAERQLVQVLADAIIAASTTANRCEELAGALLGSQADRFAVALAEAEARAATLRGMLVTLQDLALTAPGMNAPMTVTLTERARRLVANPPANAGAKVDKGIGEAFRAHFAALLVDADAALACEAGHA